MGWQGGLKTEWDTLTADPTFLDSPGGLGFLGWYLTFPGYGFLQLSGWDIANDISAKPFRSARRESMPTPPPSSAGNSSNSPTQSERSVRRTSNSHSPTGVCPALKMKMDFAKIAVRLIQRSRPSTHGELWFHWFRDMEENVILNRVQAEHNSLGITPEVLRLEIEAEPGREAPELH